jgi:hypothetical protein
MTPRWAINLLGIIGILMLLAGCAGFVADNMETFEDGSVTLFGTQIHCKADHLCQDYLGEDRKFEHPDDR